MNVNNLKDLPIRPGDIVSVLRAIVDDKTLQGYLDAHCARCQGRIWVSAGTILAARVGELIDDEALHAIIQGGGGTCTFIATTSVPPRRLLNSAANILLEMEFAARKLASTQTTRGPSEGDMLSLADAPPELADFVLPKEAAPVDPSTSPPKPSSPPGTPAVSASGSAADAGLAGAAPAGAERGGRGNGSRLRGRLTPMRVITLLVTLIVVEGVVIAWALNPSRKRHWEEERVALDRVTAEKQAAFRGRLDEVIARGDQAMLAGDLERAVACYRDAQTMDPADRRVGTILTLASTALRDRASELEAAQRSAMNRVHLEELKGRVDRLIELGDTESQAGRLEPALKFYEKALTMAPENRGIQSLISRARERLGAESAASAAANRGDDASAKARRLVAQADAKRQAGAPAAALPLYTEALLLTPDDAELRRRIDAISAELAQRTAPPRKSGEWVLDVRVGASTVRTMDLGGSGVVDMLVTANGGVVRVGKLDAMGKATEVFFENTHPRSSGNATFTMGGISYGLRWDLVESESLPTYHIVVSKVP